MAAVACPDRLVHLLLEGREVRQPPVLVNHDRWIRSLPHVADAVSTLPAHLDRDVVRAIAEHAPPDDMGAILVFLASQIWGYGTVSYGPFRVAAALQHEGVGSVLAQARSRLASGSPEEAFEFLVCANTIPRLGTSFGSKYLYFAGDGEAAILDSVVASWIQEHTGIRLPLARSSRAYSRYLDLLRGWSQMTSTAVAQIELAIFADGLPPDSPWLPPV